MIVKTEYREIYNILKPISMGVNELQQQFFQVIKGRLQRMHLLRKK